MYINTASKQEISISICDVLNIDKDELNGLLESCYSTFQMHRSIFILDDQYDYFIKYVKEHLSISIDEILFIHLSRRVKNDYDNNGYNLVDVLTKDTSLSKFMNKYGLTFKFNRHIKMYKGNQEINLNDNNYIYNYLKSRFGYIINDYSIKGYVFDDRLIHNENYEIAQGGPEFFGYLYPFIDDDFIDDYIENSKFYKFKYLVPIENICFENYEQLNNIEKQYHIVVKALQRLYAYKYETINFDDNNPTISIKNNQTLKSRYLINKIEIKE